jgi:hypothetical protein
LNESQETFRKKNPYMWDEGKRRRGLLVGGLGGYFGGDEVNK